MATKSEGKGGKGGEVISLNPCGGGCLAVLFFVAVVWMVVKFV